MRIVPVLRRLRIATLNVDSHVLIPGITISVPAGSSIEPVTSVRKWGIADGKAVEEWRRPPSSLVSDVDFTFKFSVG